MTKLNLLKHIAETGYNVGYGAKKHFATYDLAAKAPGIISFLTFSVGLYFLLIDFTAKKYFSAACLILGMVGLRGSMWDHKKEEYSKAGRELTGIFNKVKALYFQVKAAEDDNLTRFETKLASLQDEFNSLGISNQMLFSDWYAHYKFFSQQQIEWIEEHRPFSFWRDKLPLSFSAFVALSVFGVLVALALNYR